MTSVREIMPALVAATIATGLTLFDGTVVTVALPQMQRDLDLSLQSQGWVVQAYLLVPIGLLPVAGVLADNLGRRRVFELGLVVFALASVLCAVAPNAALLVGGRALQGVGVGLLVPASLGLLSSAGTSRRQRSRAVMLWTSWTGVATGLGPVLGGILAGGPGWRSFFWLTAALAIPALVLARTMVHDTRDPHRTPLPWTGAGLAVLAAGGTALGLGQITSEGLSSPLAFVPLAAGVLAAAGLAVHIRRSSAPVVPPILFSHPSFRSATLLTGIVYGALFGALLFVSLFLQQVLGLSSGEAGLALAPFAFGLVLAGPPAERVAARRGPRAPTSVGCLLAGGALAATAVLATPTTVQLIVAMAVAGLGLGMAAGPLMATVVDSVERRRAAIAAGVNAATSRVAAIGAVTVLGIAGSAAFDRSVDERAIPPEAERATANRAFAAPSVLERLQAPEGAVLAAREATDESFRVVLGIAAAALLLGAVIAVLSIGDPDLEHTGEMPIATAPSPASTALRRRLSPPDRVLIERSRPPPRPTRGPGGPGL